MRGVVAPVLRAAQRRAADLGTSTGEVILDTNGVQTCMEAFGNPNDPALVLINGACSSMIRFHVDMCKELVAGGLYVIRYDPRDVGRSTAFPPGEPPYDLRDLADDLVALLDACGIERAHLVGASSGGMIAQLAALRHPDRVRTLTLTISSPEVPAVAHTVDETTSGTTKPEDVFSRVPDEVRRLAQVDWRNREEALPAFLDEAHLMAGTAYPVDEAEVRAWAPLEYDRQRDILSFRFNTAIAETRTPAWRSRLPEITAPTLVIHGTADPVLPFANAEAMSHEIPGAGFLPIEGMGHEMPRPAWPVMLPAILAHVASYEDERRFAELGQ